ncbi:hypothetical protein NUW58_g4582 [Xylaria curta]|uniref:Uncharacterized protein n=1 Tax=Xylaria curta TaxID=42375 RepID=A0ACC1P8H2_9PEZI|nr:hypothetical protein NUW58_g4582 [Xylaria curta]
MWNSLSALGSQALSSYACQILDVGGTLPVSSQHRDSSWYSDVWGKCLLEEEVSHALSLAHDTRGHFGSPTSLRKLNQTVFWLTMAQDIVDYIRGCIQCAQFNPATPRAPDLPVTISEPFQILVVDFVGPFVTSDRKFKYILCVVDVFSRYRWGFPSLFCTASTAFVFMRQWRDQVGTIPLAIYSDPGSALFSREFYERMGELGIHTLNAPPKPHKSVGVVEIFNPIVQSVLNKIHDSTYPKY